MVKVDLHLHTTCSDGRLTPTELVRLCGSRGLEVIAVTDHDSTEGISEALEAAKAFPQMTVIAGVELSTDIPSAEIHLLGYFVDRKDQDFQRMLEGLRGGREARAYEMVRKLADLGIDISWERVLELSGEGAIGRPHIAQAMVEAGYVQYPRDAFAEYIGRNGLAYVERAKLTPAEAVAALTKNGALPVMAHPTYSALKSSGDNVNDLKETLSQLKEAGLVGMEVYYKNYTPDQVNRLAALAEELDLVPCGGSDYHGAGNPGEPEPGAVGPPIATVKELDSLRRLRTTTAMRAES